MRALTVSGLLAVLAGAVGLAALHVVGPGARISPVSLTISEYGLTSASPVFTLAVLLVAAGGAAIVGCGVVAAWRGGRGKPAAVTAVTGALAVTALTVVGLVHKTDWSVGPSLGGTVHRIAGLVAFFGLPVAVIALLWGVRGSAAARWARGLSMLAPVWFAPLFFAIVTEMNHGRWWQAVPLGLLERGLALTDIAAVVAVALWLRSVKPNDNLPNVSNRIPLDHECAQCAPTGPRSRRPVTG